MSNTATAQNLVTESELVDDEATNAVWIFEFEGDHLRVGDHRSYKTVTTRDELEDFLVQYARS